MMPLDDYIDSLLDPGSRRRRRRVSPTFEMTPQQQSSLIGRVGGSALSGLSAGANLLDLGGSMVRDVVGGIQTGRWDRHNPLDQLLDPFGRHAEENRVTGRDLLRNAGAIGRRNTWGNFAGGLAADVALDPLTYATFGASALGKAGKAAKAAGSLAPTLAGQIAAKQRGLIGLRAPFSESVLPLGTGKGAQAVARGIDTAAEAVRFGNIPGTSFSPGRLTARLFDAELGDTATREGQKLAKGLAPKRTAAAAEQRLFAATQTRRLIDAGLVEPKHGDALRRAIEGFPKAGDPQFDPKILDDIWNENDQLLQRAQAPTLRMDVEALQDSAGTKYFQRYLSAEGGTQIWKRRVLDTTDKSQLGREWYMKEITGGTDTIQKIARDSDVEDAILKAIDPADPMTATGVRNVITAKYGDVFLGNADHSAKQHGTRFVESLMGMRPETRAAGVFGNHPMADMMHGMVARRDAIEVSEGLVDFLQKSPSVSNSIGPNTVPLDDVLESLKIAPDQLKGQGLHIDAELAADIKRLHQGFTQPESVNDLLKIVDSTTNLFKMGVTGTWPAFHVRNRVSGLWQNYVAGMVDMQSELDGVALLRGGVVKNAHKIKIVEDELIRRGLPLTERNGTEVISDLAFAHELIGKYEGQAVDVAGQAASPGVQTLDDIMGMMPGVNPTKSLFGTALDVQTFAGARGGTSLNPLRVRGVGDQTTSKFGPAKWGENLGHFIEGQNRLSPFINQLRKGIDPATAAQKVGAAQVLYHGKHYTPFESQALARLFPFFKFTSRMVPYQLRMLADQPGGKLGVAMRAINRARDPNELTPDYVAETSAIPLGQSADGTSRFLTGFGLPIEDTMSMLTPDVRSGGLELLSRMNPLVKAPLEYATGQTFFQKGPQGGRSLDDLDPTIGRTIANVRELMGGEKTRYAKPVAGSSALEFVLANSPISRGLTTARTLSDPRKGTLSKIANAATGFRVSDISPAAQDALLQERADEAMRRLGGREYEITYIPEEIFAAMSPEQKLAALQLEALKKEMQKRKRERKAAE